MRIPHVLEAVERREAHRSAMESKDLWAIGDALLTDCGENFETKAKAVAEELKRQGYRDYHTRYLVELGETAKAYPRARRHANVSFTTHREAGGPDFLDYAVAEIGPKITFRQALKLRQRWELLQRKEHKARHEAAKEEVRMARTPEAKERAERKERELAVMPDPKPRQTPRPEGDMAMSLRMMEFVLDCESEGKLVAKQLQKRLTAIHDKRDRIDVEYIDAIVGAYEEVAKIATQIVDTLGKTRLKRFDTIRGGKAS